MSVSRSSRFLILVVATAMGAAVFLPLLFTSENRLVLYCAHDQVLAADVIRRFEQESGIQVDVRYDEEANKSLGLTQLLLAEKDAPRADVFWNNQLLGTIRLQSAGVLKPYRGFGWNRIPASFRDADGYWTGFAARQRVYIMNTNRMDATTEAITQRLQQPSLEDVAIAEPLFGTTLSHYCVLAEQMGLNELKNWHHDIRKRGIRVVRGNSMVKDLVAEGICDMGFTDTDDAFAAVDAGMPVTMLPVRLKTGQTICLPNSVAMIAGCRHPEAAERFIDFLLTEETELRLASGAGRQIPLGPVDRSRLSDDLRPLVEWATDAVPLTRAADFHAPVADWLNAESTGQ
jgi:iron(III) transport system substrate-binding protein